VNGFPANSTKTERFSYVCDKEVMPKTLHMQAFLLTLSSFVVRSVVSSFCLASSSRMRLEEEHFNQIRQTKQSYY
jgi:hypothetical protein